jgi:hypothetical protein
MGIKPECGIFIQRVEGATDPEGGLFIKRDEGATYLEPFLLSRVGGMDRAGTYKTD